MPDDTTALRNLAERLLAIADGRRRKPRDTRPNVNFRIEPDELIALDNAARARGVCRSDLIREALEPVLGCSMLRNRSIPPGFQRRRKPIAERYRPTDTDNRAREAASLAIAARTALLELGAANIPNAHIGPEMLTERAGRSASKLRPR